MGKICIILWIMFVFLWLFTKFMVGTMSDGELFTYKYSKMLPKRCLICASLVALDFVGAVVTTIIAIVLA